MNVGGPAVLLAEVASGLESQGIKHTIITGRCLHNEVDYLELHPREIDLIRLNKISRSVFLIDDLMGFFELVRVLRRLDPDIVHTHTSKAGVLGRIAARVGTPKAKVVHTFHGHLLYGYFSPWKLRLIVQTEKVLAKISDVLVAVSNPVNRDLVNAGIGVKNRWEVIHPAVSLNENHSQKNSMRDGKLHITWIGRFAEVKNPMLAIEAFSVLPESLRKQIDFTMVGDGDFKEITVKESKRLGLEIIFTGWHPNPIEILKDSDLLLMTSKNEGLPVGMLEAASVGVPTLSTDVGGVTDFITDGQTGWLTPSDAHSLATRLSAILENKSNRQAVGNRAHDRILTQFSIESYVQKHIELYEGLGSK